MNVPPEISFRGVERNPRLETFLERRIDKLEEICDYINGCRIAVEKPHEHQKQGNPYRVRIDVTVPPGKELAATAGQLDNDLHDELRTVIVDAFEAMERQLRELVERQRGDVKTSDDVHGLVTKLFPDDDYGFLKDIDTGREVFFHRSAVVNDAYDELQTGTEVRFVEVEGEDGPQASTVQVIGKPGSRDPQVEEPSMEMAEGWKRKGEASASDTGG